MSVIFATPFFFFTRYISVRFLYLSVQSSLLLESFAPWLNHRACTCSPFGGVPMLCNCRWLRCRQSYTWLPAPCLPAQRCEDQSRLCFPKIRSKQLFIEEHPLSLGMSDFRWYERRVYLTETVSTALSENGSSGRETSLQEQSNHIDWWTGLSGISDFFQIPYLKYMIFNI